MIKFQWNRTIKPTLQLAAFAFPLFEFRRKQPLFELIALNTDACSKQLFEGSCWHDRSIVPSLPALTREVRCVDA